MSLQVRPGHVAATVRFCERRCQAKRKEASVPGEGTLNALAPELHLWFWALMGPCAIENMSYLTNESIKVIKLLLLPVHVPLDNHTVTLLVQMCL